MKIAANFSGKEVKKDNRSIILLRATDPRDDILVDQLFAAKQQREDRRKEESFVVCEIVLPLKSKSQTQLGAVFLLVDAIFESQNGRKPSKDEQYDLYLDLLDLYADRVPNSLKPGTDRPVHLSESDTVNCAHFIEALMYHLATECQLAASKDVQADVRKVLYQFEVWRAGQEKDPCLYYNGEPISEEKYRELHPYCEATGDYTRPVQLHHIVTRGANAKAINEPWNWVMLCDIAHAFRHENKDGEKGFLRRYPHLCGKFEKAHEIADKLYSNECL